MKIKLINGIGFGLCLSTLLTTNVSADVEDKVITIRTQKDLDAYLSRNGYDLGVDNLVFELSESIRFPKRMFKVQRGEALWSFKGTGKPVTIDLGGSTFVMGLGGDFFWLGTGKHGDENGHTIIKNGNFYGSVTTATTDNGSILNKAGVIDNHPSIFSGGKSHGYGMFMAQFLKASFITVRDMTFNNVHYEDSHVFDLAGSDHIRFYNNTFAGYGGREFTEDEIRKRFMKHPHSMYSEAVQIDAAIPGTFGSFNAKGTILDGVSLDGTTSNNLVFEQNRFTTYNGLDGEGMIEADNSRKIIRNYSAGIGSHTRGNAEFHDIFIRNNLFNKTINFANNNHGERPLTYPIHFFNVTDLEKNRIFVVDNRFVGTQYVDNSGELIYGKIGIATNVSEGNVIPRTFDTPISPEMPVAPKQRELIAPIVPIKPTEVKQPTHIDGNEPIRPLSPVAPKAPIAPKSVINVGPAPKIPIEPPSPRKPIRLVLNVPVEPMKPNVPVEPMKPNVPNKPMKPSVPFIEPVEPTSPVAPISVNKPVEPIFPTNDLTKPIAPIAPEVPKTLTLGVAPIEPEKPIDIVAPKSPRKPIEPVAPILPKAPALPIAVEDMNSSLLSVRTRTYNVNQLSIRREYPHSVNGSLSVRIKRI